MIWLTLTARHSHSDCQFAAANVRVSGSVCGCGCVWYVCYSASSVFCLGNKLLIIIWKELQRWWGPTARTRFCTRLHSRPPSTRGRSSTRTVPRPEVLHISRQTLSLLCESSGHVIRTFAALLRHAVGSQASVAVAHFKLNFYGRLLDEAREGPGRSFSKLTFIRAQDLCINVPSILATCVCSFQMRITTTATTSTTATETRSGTNKFCAVSIEMQLKAEVCLACSLVPSCLPSKLKKWNTYV